MEQSAHPVPIAPGDVLAGKYRVERLLGRGGMGLVVAARHSELGELFAIKLLLPQAAADPQAVDRFLREARAAVRLKGEHVAKVTDVGRLENGSPYIVMEHLSGMDLRAHVRANGPLSVGEAAAHVLQACEAIAEAHSLGIVHRDIKPSNLFLTRRANGTACVKVLDFGISKHLTNDAVEITKTGEILGTPLYMAPEQMARMKSADARADIWSMGIVLYELLTGTTPFHSTMITEVVARVLQEDVTPPSHVRPGLPPAIDALVMKSLQKRPDQRFQSIHEFAAALRAAGAPSAFMTPLPGTPPDITFHTASALSAPSAPATMDLSVSELPTSRISVPGSGPQTPVGNTESAWGTTNQLRRMKRSHGLVWALCLGGAAAAALVVLGLWLSVRAPQEGPAPSSPAASAAPIIAAPPVTTTTVSVAPAGAEPPAPSASPSANSTAPLAASTTPALSSAAPSAPAALKSSLKKPPGAPSTRSAPASPDAPKFGEIR